jgi:hypothetical protein
VTTFAREWNAALTLVVLAATILFATDHVLAGAAAVAFGAVAIVARWTAMRRQNLSFYEQDKGAR